MLSQYKASALVNGIRRSCRRVYSQINLATMEAMALYSTVALDLATRGSFFALQEMHLLPKKMQ